MEKYSSQKIHPESNDLNQPTVEPSIEPFSVDAPHSKVQLFISCRNLKDLDIVSKSDPICFLHTKNNKDDQQWYKYDQTERKDDDLNPDFAKCFTMNYYFEKHQYLRFLVVDDDGNKQYEDIGTVETTLAQILSSVETGFESDLRLPGQQKTRGKLIVRPEIVIESKWQARFQVSVVDLPPRRSFCCKAFPHPLLEIYRVSDSQPNVSDVQFKVYRSEVLKNTILPSFKLIKISGEQLCNSNKDLSLSLRVIDRVKKTNEVLIGKTNLSFNEMEMNRQYPLIGASNQPVGSMIFGFKQCRDVGNFLDYLKSGWQIKLFAAIDFTGSNGKTNEPKSLHAQGKGNQYIQAIKAVGSILEAYSKDKQFCAYGFGGKPEGFTQVSDCFPLNGHASSPEVQGTEGILEAYQKMLETTELAGPTHFRAVIKEVSKKVHANALKKSYGILLLLTDGILHDMNQTATQIIEASVLPLSIIIVGVGTEKFSKMKWLDGDHETLKNSQGRKAKRDIVQFVKFRKYQHSGPEILAAQVLKEVPDQIVSYMQMNNIKPVMISSDNLS